jgi:SAM-dependent methyltransferase
VISSPAAPVPDLFGQALLDYIRGGRIPVHLRRGDGRLAVAELAPYFDGFEGFSSFERSLLAKVRGSVLDIGAGAGRFSLYLQALATQGGTVTDVVALDSSAGACGCMRRQGVRAVVHSSWQRVRDAQIWPERFDAVILGGNGLGLAGSEESLPEFLGWLCSLLKTGGIVLATALAPDTGAAAQTVRLRVEYRGRVGEWFDWLTVSPERLGQLAEGTGLSPAEWFPRRDAAEYGVSLLKAITGAGPRAGSQAEVGGCTLSFSG